MTKYPEKDKLVKNFNDNISLKFSLNFQNKWFQGKYLAKFFLIIKIIKIKNNKTFN